MTRKVLFTLGSLAILACLTLGFKIHKDLQSRFEVASVPSVEASEITEQEAIKEAIVEAYHNLGQATLTFDTSKLEVSFIDDPRFPLPWELRREVELAFGSVPDGAGALTYMKAWYKNWERGAKRWEEIEEQARKEGREVSVEEMRALIEELGFEPVSRRTEPFPPGRDEWFRFYDFKVEGDVAECLYDDGGCLRKAFLVKKGGKWYIADRRLLECHY